MRREREGERGRERERERERGRERESWRYWRMENDFPADEKRRRNKKRHFSAQTPKVGRNKRRNCVQTDLIFKCAKLT